MNIQAYLERTYSPQLFFNNNWLALFSRILVFQTSQMYKLTVLKSIHEFLLTELFNLVTAT